MRGEDYGGSYAWPPGYGKQTFISKPRTQLEFQVRVRAKPEGRS